MYAAHCRCGQTIYVRNVRLDEDRVFFLSLWDGALHGRTVCPRCGEPLSLDALLTRPPDACGLSIRSRRRTGLALKPWRTA